MRAEEQGGRPSSGVVVVPTTGGAPSAELIGARNDLLREIASRAGGERAIPPELWARMQVLWAPEQLRMLVESADLRPPETANGAGEHPERPTLTRQVPAPRTVLLIASMGVFMAFVDATIVNIAFPDIRRSFAEAGLSHLSWVINAYNLVFAAFLVAAGRFSDLLGRRRLYVVGLGLFTLASVVCAAAPSVDVLIGARILQALGAAILVPASLALVLNAFPAGERAHAIALWTAAAAVAAGIGPGLGGVLIEIANWRLAFLVNLPFGVAAVMLALRKLVESRAPGHRRLPDLPGSFVLAVAVAALTLAIVQGGDWGWASAKVLGSFTAGLALGAIVLRRCATHRSPVIDLDLLRVRSFAVANAVTLFGGAGYFAYILCNVLFLTAVWGYSVLEAGLAMTPGPFVAAAIAGPLGRIADRAGPRVVLAPGALVWAAGVVYLIAAVGTQPAFVSEWLPGQVILGIGAGACLPTASGAAVASAPGERFATATALNSVARQFGAVVGVALLVAIVGTPAPNELAEAFDRGWAFSAGMLLLIALGALFLGRVRTASEVADAELAAEEAARRAALATLGTSAPPELHARRAQSPRAFGSPNQFLRTVPLFADLDPGAYDGLAARTRRVELRAGEWLFRQGDRGDALYVVYSGRVEVMKETPTPELVTTLGRGGVIGELALLTDEPRAASLRALRDSSLLQLGRDDFVELLHGAPGFAVQLTRELAGQVQRSKVSQPPTRPLATTIAVVPLEGGLPVRDLARALTARLEGWHRAVLLDGSDGGERDPDAAVAEYGALLDSFEQQHDQVVLLAAQPTAGDAWTRFCLREADRILALTAGGPLPEAIARDASLRGCDLVHCGPAGLGEAVSASHRALEPAASYRVMPDAFDAGVAAMARRLSGRSVGLVLSGGGARAFAHLGVIEELQRAGVVIDRVGGTSMGAYIGAMLAGGMGAEEMDAYCFEEWVRRSPLNDYRLPTVSLIRGEKAYAMLQRTFGERWVEELPLSFYCASADLRHNEVVIHRGGKLIDQLAATLCLPVLGEPRVHGRRLLVDGSVLNNLPVEGMAHAGEGPIIAVDIKVGGRSGSGSRDAAKPPEQAGTRIPDDRPPRLLETLARIVLLGSTNTSKAAAEHADLVITPHSAGIGLLEFHQLDVAREAGRRAAQAALEVAPERMLP